MSLFDPCIFELGLNQLMNCGFKLLELAQWVLNLYVAVTKKEGASKWGKKNTPTEVERKNYSKVSLSPLSKVGRRKRR